MEAAQKLARTDNPQTSKDAAEKMVKSGALNRQESQVYNAILDSYAKDFTTKEIAERMSEFRRYADYFKWYDICRKRFSDLQMKGKIETILIDIDEKTGRGIYKRRDSCRVWRLV